MKKALIIGMVAAAGMLLAASCANDELNGSEPGGEATISFSIGLENDVQTRAISDGSGVNMLVYAVYDANGGIISSTDGIANGPQVKGSADDSAFTELTAKVDLTLAKGQTYKVVFWAQNASCTAYSYDEKMNITVDYTTTVTEGDESTTENAANNDETRDAFYAVKEITVTKSESIEVKLKRPFAQINVGVTSDDWDDAGQWGIEIEKSAVTISGVANKISLLDGSVSVDKTNGFDGSVTYNAAAIPNTSENANDESATESTSSTADPTLTVNSTKYYWLSMSYILADDESTEKDSDGLYGSQKTTLESLKYTFTPKSGSDITLSLTSIPVQRNYRTNIVGKILTGDISFEVILDKAYNESDKITEFWDGKTTTAVTASDDGIYYVSTASELAWIAEQVNEGNSSTATKAGAYFSGKTIQLTNDIYLNNQPWTPIGTLPDGENVKDNKDSYALYGFQGTFNGDGYTIYGLNASSNNATGLFGALYGNVTIKNVIVDGATVTSNHYAGVIAGYYNAEGSDHILTIDSCYVKNSSVTVSVETLSDGSYDNGDKAGGIIGHSAGYSYPVSITNCSVESTSISAYRDLGGIIGNIVENSTETTLTNNKVTDVTLTIDLSTTYSISSGYNPGEIVGRNDGDVTLDETNTSSDVTIEMNLAEGTTEVEISGGDATSVVVALNDDDITTVVILNDTDLSEATAEDLTFDTAKTIEIEEDATILLGSNSLTTTAGLTLTGGGTIETTAEEGTTGEQVTLINVESGECVIDGVTLINDTDYHYHGSGGYESKSAAILYDAAEITIKNSTIISGMFTICAVGNYAGTSVTIEDSYLESTSSSLDESGNYAYALDLYGSYVTINDCEMKGIHGALGLGYCVAEINGGTYYTVNSEGKTDAFYAVYAYDYSDVTITGGKFSAPNDRSGSSIDIEGTSAVISHYDATLNLQGGQYSGKAYDLDSSTSPSTYTLYDTPAEGFTWQALDSDDSGLNLKWEVVKSE